MSNVLFIVFGAASNRNMFLKGHFLEASYSKQFKVQAASSKEHSAAFKGRIG